MERKIIRVCDTVKVYQSIDFIIEAKKKREKLTKKTPFGNLELCSQRKKKIPHTVRYCNPSKLF